MKLVLAIINRGDAPMVTDALTEEKIQVTKLATTGGFLKAGNVTLIIGIEDNMVDKVIDIISKYSSKRTQLATNAMSFDMPFFNSSAFEVTAGGATIFVLNVDRFEKV